MFLPEFKHLAPRNLTEALKLLQKEGSRAKPLAGGTDLLLMMKEGRIQPETLLSLRGLSELHQIEDLGSRWKVGAAVTVSKLANSSAPETNAALADLIPLMASPQIRNRASIGGNICNAAACADLPPMLLVSEAVAHIASSESERELPLEQFITGPRTTALRDNELLVSVTFQRHNPGSAFVKFGPRALVNIAIVGVAASLELSGDKITKLSVAITAAAPAPILIRISEDNDTPGLGEKPSDELWQKIADRAREMIQPISDLRGSADYRRHLTTVGTVRALQTAAKRWRESHA